MLTRYEDLVSKSVFLHHKKTHAFIPPNSSYHLEINIFSHTASTISFVWTTEEHFGRMMIWA